MKIEELYKEGKIIDFQDDYCIIDVLNILKNKRINLVCQLSLKNRLILCVIIFINKNIKFYQLLKKLKI